MSSTVDKLTSSTFESKSLKHLLSYSPIDAVVKLLLSFSLVAAVYNNFVIPAWELVNKNIISAYSFIYNPLTKADELVDDVVLSHYVDDVAIKYPADFAEKISDTYVKPTNDYLYDQVVNKYLPDAEYKFEEGKSEFNKFAHIIYQFVVRVKTQAIEKSSAISNKLASTYHEEIKTVAGSDPVPTLYNNLTATFNTATKTLTELNESHIKPLRAQTQEYVTEVASSTRSKADSFIADTKKSIPSLPQLNEKGHQLLNGSTISVSG